MKINLRSRLSAYRVIVTCLLSQGGLAFAHNEPKGGSLPEFDFLYGWNELFPSALVCFTADSPKAPSDPKQLGDHHGVISVRLRAPRDDALVRVTFSETTLFEESQVAVKLPKAGEEYRVAPVVRYRHERLAALKQPLASLVVQARVEFPDATGIDRTPEVITTRVVVHSVNDFIQRYRFRETPEDSLPWNFEAKYMIAAYVNENNPWIDQRITRHALDHFVDSFKGYLVGASEVQEQAEAVYNTLRALGFRSSQLTEASAAPQAGISNVRVQYVRLPGDSLSAAQANATEAALLLASVFQKMDMDTVLLILPEAASTPKAAKRAANQTEGPEASKKTAKTAASTRALLGLYLERHKVPSSLIVIDTGDISGLTFAEAVDRGKRRLDEATKEKLFFTGRDAKTQREKAEEKGYFAIDISLAREGGILPIPEMRRELPSVPMTELATVVAHVAPSRISSFSILAWLPSTNTIIVGTVVIVALILFFGLRKKKT